jgi:hypothetical protein
MLVMTEDSKTFKLNEEPESSGNTPAESAKKDNLLLPGLRPSGSVQRSSSPTDNALNTGDAPKKDTGSTGVNNPPVLDKGRVKDTNLTNQDGQPLENNPLVTGDTGKGSQGMGLKVDDKSKVIDERLPVNTADGTSAGAGLVATDDHERMEERDKIVIDRVSGNPVLVQPRIREDKLEEYKNLLKQAHDSLDGANPGEVAIAHPYWGLSERARQFGKSNGLI